MRFALAGALLALAHMSPALADEPISTLEAALVQELAFVEPFSSTDGALSGLVEPGPKGPWTITLDGATATYVNDTASSAVRYVILNHAKFPADGSGTRAPTDGGQVSLTVRVTESRGGAAGLAAGYADGGDYFVFAIGVPHRYVIYRKTDGKLRSFAHGTSDAIRPGVDNRLSLHQDNGTFRFAVNGVELFTTTDAELRDAPVGVAVVGKGTYVLDDFTIEPPPSILKAFRAPSCDLATANANDLVASVSSHDSPTISTASLAGQDKVTSALDAVLEPGDRPIYLVVSSKTPTIWRFSGNVGRLSHIAVFGPVGIAGVPEAKIAFHEGDCVAMFGQKPTLRARIALSLGLGHVVDVIAGQNSLSSVQLPSGEVASEVGIIARGIPPTADSELLLRALRYNPGGVASIDAGSVLSRGDVEPYDVLPQHWGLIELVAKGSLKRTDPHSREDSFTILKPMRFPGGLDRSPALTFYLPEGVPMPEGDPGQSKVLPLPDTSNDADLTEQPEA